MPILSTACLQFFSPIPTVSGFLYLAEQPEMIAEKYKLLPATVSVTVALSSASSFSHMSQWLQARLNYQAGRRDCNICGNPGF